MELRLILERLADNDLPLPRYATVHSAGLDFAACLTRPCKAIDGGVARDFRVVGHGIRVWDGLDCPPGGSCGDEGLRNGSPVLLIAPGETVIIPLGFRASFPPGHCLQLYVRSSIGVRGLVLANGTGIIDADYRGELMAAVHNRSDVVREVLHGERIVQGILIQSPQAAISEGSVGDSERGSGGFGSTGR